MHFECLAVHLIPNNYNSFFDLRLFILNDECGSYRLSELTINAHESFFCFFSRA